MAFSKHLLVFFAALVAGVFAGLPVLFLTVVVSGVVVFLLTFLFVAVVVAVTALWAGNLLDRGRARGRPAPVLVVSLATASLMLVLILIVGLIGAPLLAYASPGHLLLLGAAAISLNGTVMTWRSREEGRNLRRDAMRTVAVLLLSASILVAVLFLACAFGYCGA